VSWVDVFSFGESKVEKDFNYKEAFEYLGEQLREIQPVAHARSEPYLLTLDQLNICTFSYLLGVSKVMQIIGQQKLKMESQKVILPFAKLNQRIIYNSLKGKITFYAPTFNADQKQMQTYCQ
jgi:hypothetical protein